jgi:GNAT superfamily N-acetyltransferase
MAPAETVTDATVSVGYEGGGRRASVAIGVIESPSSAMIFTVSGGVRRAHARHLKLFAPVAGLHAMTSRVGAALVALEHLPVPAVTDISAARRAVITTLVGDRVANARRVAFDLAAAGCVGPLADIPMSEAERNWWSALAHIRVQQFDDAVRHLVALPDDGYPDAIGLLVWCTSSPIAAVRQHARTAVERRLRRAGHGSALAEAAAATGHTTAAIAWLIDPQPPEAILDLTTDAPSPAFELLRALQGGGDVGVPLRLPVSASLPIMDDVVDRGFRVDEQSLAAVTRDEARYLVARTHPELLTDEDVDALGFTTERDRRTMLTGRIPNSTADRPDSPMIAAIRSLVSEHRSDALASEDVGPVAEALAALLATPSADTLVDAITDDDSTWGLLEKRLDDEALRWDPPKGSSARRFLGWLALRRTLQSLYAADWHQALKHSRHALRLADTDAASGEALNMQAFAEWQLHRDDAAKKALESALDGRRQRSLQVNLSIVAPEPAPDSARSSF